MKRTTRAAAITSAAALLLSACGGDSGEETTDPGTLRLVAPILATVGILAFVMLWGEFLLASIFLLDQDQRTLGVGLYSLNMADQNRYFGMFCAGALVASLPPVLVYLSLQRQLIGGLTSGSVK